MVEPLPIVLIPRPADLTAAIPPAACGAVASGLRHNAAALRRLVTEVVGPEAFIRQRRAIMPARLAAGLSSHRLSELVLVVEVDELVLPELSAETAGGIHGAHLDAVADCGQLSTVERPSRSPGHWFSGCIPRCPGGSTRRLGSSLPCYPAGLPERDGQDRLAVGIGSNGPTGAKRRLS